MVEALHHRQLIHQLVIPAKEAVPVVADVRRAGRVGQLGQGTITGGEAVGGPESGIFGHTQVDGFRQGNALHLRFRAPGKTEERNQ